MSRNKEYQRLLNSKRWQQVRRLKMQQTKGLCEMCLAEGIVRAGVDCHHIRPVESAKSPQEMEALCFDWKNNIQVLCVEHHIKVHQEARSHSVESHKEREEDRLEQWKARHSRPSG